MPRRGRSGAPPSQGLKSKGAGRVSGQHYPSVRCTLQQQLAATATVENTGLFTAHGTLTVGWHASIVSTYGNRVPKPLASSAWLGPA